MNERRNPTLARISVAFSSSFHGFSRGDHSVAQRPWGRLELNPDSAHDRTTVPPVDGLSAIRKFGRHTVWGGEAEPRMFRIAGHTAVGPPLRQVPASRPNHRVGGSIFISTFDKALFYCSTSPQLVMVMGIQSSENRAEYPRSFGIAPGNKQVRSSGCRELRVPSLSQK